jgi:CO/xanthine dehydrogenase FAD-binding subunit
MSTLIGWAYPETLEEAVALLQQDEPRWEPVAGATSWVFRRRSGDVGLMDLTRLPLGGIADEGEQLRLGALVTFEGLRGSEVVRNRVPLLHEMAESLRPQQLRNCVTLGGNAVQVFAWSDAPVALLALGATLHLASSPDGEPREVDADSFFASHPRRRLERSLLVGATVPASRPGRGGAFQKIARSRVDLALATAAVTVELSDGIVRAARVVVGAVRGLPERLIAVEQALVGRPANDPALLSDTVQLAEGLISPVQDVRVSKEYRAHVAAVLVGRVLGRAVARGLEG